MSGAMTEEELAGLSDEELMNMEAPSGETPPAAAEESAGEAADDQPDAPADNDGNGQGEAEVMGGEDPDEDADPDAPGSDAGGDAPAEGVEDEGAEGDPPAEGAEAAGEGEDPAQPAGESEPKKGEGDPAEGDPKADPVTPEAVDYEAAYKKIMAPFKAAGKMVQLDSPEDAVQLMQMGAHYTKKMQALQPNLKLLRMLENNGLLDEGKLSYLIDVSRKDPKAIQKLVKDSGLDPLEIDTSEDPDYQPGNHSVTDAEFEFTSILEDVTSDPEGKDLVVNINKTWDAASKEAIGKDPKILQIMHQQKSNGIYEQISAEIDRRKTLGYLRNEPFLQAYRDVGAEMQAQGKLTPKPTPGAELDPNQGGQPQTEQRRVVETRPAAKKTVSNSEQAKAASPAKATPTKQAADFNPLSLSDEDFEKNAQLAQRI